MDGDAPIVSEGIALGAGIAWAIVSGYVIAAVARRRGIALDHPVGVTVVSYTFACIAYGLAFVVVGFMVAFQALVLFGTYCVPVLALVFNMILLRSAANASGAAHISFADVGQLVLATQGVLLLLLIFAIWLARMM